MVNSGICSLQETQRSLSSFGAKVFFKDKQLSQKSNGRFYRTQKDNRKHYNLAFSKRKLAKLDQENVSCWVDKLAQSPVAFSSTQKMYFFEILNKYSFKIVHVSTQFPVVLAEIGVCPAKRC